MYPDITDGDLINFKARSIISTSATIDIFDEHEQNMLGILQLLMAVILSTLMLGEKLVLKSSHLLV